jgi:hypothetical protein
MEVGFFKAECDGNNKIYWLSTLIIVKRINTAELYKVTAVHPVLYK